MTKYLPFYVSCLELSSQKWEDLQPIVEMLRKLTADECEQIEDGVIPSRERIKALADEGGIPFDECSESLAAAARLCSRKGARTIPLKFASDEE